MQHTERDLGLCRYIKDAGCRGGRWHDVSGGAGRGAAAGGGEAREPEDPPHDHHIRQALARHDSNSVELMPSAWVLGSGKINTSLPLAS